MSSAGCSLLAPSRDELSGGKSELSVDGQAPDSNAGSGGTGGTASTPDGSGGAADVSAGDAEPPIDPDSGDGARDAMVNVLSCSNLGSVGQWQLITPKDVSVACPDSGYCSTFGPEAFALDPQNSGTIYFGTSAEGIWKSIDCGGSWKQVNTGTNSTTLSAGTQFMFVIDPVDSQVMYTTGQDQQLFKSIDGGVDWDKIWPSKDTAVASAIRNQDLRSMELDPLDHLHMILGFASTCVGTASGVCFAETTDGGSNWHLINGKVDWKGGSGRIWILDATSWLYSSGSDGLWRTSDKGVTWKQLADSSVGAAFSNMYRAPDGSLYVGGDRGIFRSADGELWSLTNSNTQYVKGGITSDGTTLYASSFGVCNEWGPDLQLYSQSPVTDGKMWSRFQAPGMTQGAVALNYDRQHHILYSSNCRAGFWRVVTE